MVRTPRSVMLLVVTAALVLLAVPPAFATTASAIIKAVNAERTARGLAPLQSYGDNSMAQRSNDAFVATGDLHGLFKEAGSWYRAAGATSVAENQARFPESSASAKAVAKAWADSKGHAANQFSPGATHIAAAVKTSGGNVYYTVHVLEAASHQPPEKSEPEPSPKPANKAPPKPQSPPPAPAEAAPPPERTADEPPDQGELDDEVADVEPRNIVIPRQMTVLEPVNKPAPDTPAQLRPASAGSTDRVTQVQARILGLATVVELARIGEVARVPEVARGAAEVAGAGRQPEATGAPVTAVVTPRAGAGLGFTGLGGVIGLVAAMLHRRRRRDVRRRAL